MATYNFPDHKKGDTFPGTVFTIVQNSLPVDLTNYTIRMHLRPARASSTLSQNMTSSIEIHDPAAGKFRINPVVIDLPARTYYHDIEFTNTVTGAIRTWIEGTWNVTQDVTR